MELIVLVFLLFLSAVFSGSETALITISMARVESLTKEESRGSRALLKLKSDTPKMLITILIGNNLVNIAAASMATVLATEWFGHIGPGIAVGILTIVILVFGEITPKSLATRYSEKISLFIAPIILALMRMLYPIVWMFDRFTTWINRNFEMASEPTVTESELIRMLGHGEKEGTIEQGEREMIERVFAFNDLTVRDVMTPLHAVFSLNESQSVEEALPEVMAQPFSRIPVFTEQPDKIRGVLFLRSLLEASAEGKKDVPLSEITLDPVFVPQYQPIDELFATLRQEMRHLAVVVDEHGTTLGIVTLEDVIEELVGEIYDESDRTPNELTQVAEGLVQTEGDTELRLVKDYFDVELPGKPTDTINFWLLSHTERIPETGESFALDGLKVTVERASKHRIDVISISKSDTP